MDDCLKYNTLNSSRRHLKQWQVIHTNHNLLLTFPLVFNLKAQSHKGDKWKATPMQQNAQSHLHDLQPQQLRIYSLRSLLRLFWAVWLGFWQVSWSHIPSSQSAATAETELRPPSPRCVGHGASEPSCSLSKNCITGVSTPRRKTSVAPRTQ